MELKKKTEVWRQSLVLIFRFNGIGEGVSQSAKAGVQKWQMQFTAFRMTIPSGSAEMPTIWMCFHLSWNEPNGRILITLSQNRIRNLWGAGCPPTWPVIWGAFSPNSMFLERLLTWRLLVRPRNWSRTSLIAKFRHICLHVFSVDILGICTVQNSNPAYMVWFVQIWFPLWQNKQLLWVQDFKEQWKKG